MTPGTTAGLHAMTASQIKNILSLDSNRFSIIKELASDMRCITDSLSSFIQEHTDAVCPQCEKVCCINRHSHYDRADLVYIIALGVMPPQSGKDTEDSEPCHFLNDRGCTLSRSVRPHRCNWFFCDPLLSHMQSVSAMQYRNFISNLEKLTSKRVAMINEFTALAGTTTVSP